MSLQSHTNALVVDIGTGDALMDESPHEHHQAALNVFTLGVSPTDMTGQLSGHRREHLIFTDVHGWNNPRSRKTYAKCKFTLLDRICGYSKAIVVAAGSSPVFHEEISCAMERGWPILALSDSSGDTDHLIEAVTTGKSEDPLYQAAADGGRVVVFNSKKRPADFAQLIRVHQMVDVFGIQDRSALWWKKGQPEPNPDDGADTGMIVEDEDEGGGGWSDDGF